MAKDPRTSMDSLLDAAESDYFKRAKGISSATRSTDEIGKTSQRHINSLSNDVSSLTKRQKEIEKQLEDIDKYKIPASKEMKAVSSSILHNVNLAMLTLASGMKKITLSTAGALKDAVGDYGRAISEDFSINKQNLTAMALSRITPVFGYFVSKFMQTDVYRRAIDKIKNSFSSVFHAITSKIGGAFGRGREEANIDSVVKKLPRRPKKMAAGGYIARGGLAQVHAAEVIMPIDTVLDRIDRRGGNVEIQQEMLASLQDLNIHMRTFSDSYRKDVMHRKGLIGDFARSLISGEYGRSWEMQMLFLQKEMRNAMVDANKNTRERMAEAMEVTMRRHPTFRNILRYTGWTVKFAKWMMLTIPVKTPYRVLRWAFGKRDKYSTALGKALSGSSPFVRMESVLTLIYTSLAPNLDRMNAALHSIAANIFNLTERALGAGKGEPYKYDVDSWTKVGRIFGAIAAPFKKSKELYGRARQAISAGLGERIQLEEAQRTRIPALIKMVKVGGRYVSEAEAPQIRKQMAEEQKRKTGVVYQTKELVKIRMASEKTADNTSTLMSKVKKFGSDLLFYLGLGFSMIKSVLGIIPGFGSIMKGLGSLGGAAASLGSGIWKVGKGLLSGIIRPLISTLGSWITKLLGSIGLGSLGATLGTSLTTLGAGGVTGIGTILIGSIAAGIIGYGIGWVVNKGMDWLFGEEGGLGSWVYEKLNPMIDGKRKFIVAIAWDQIKDWADMVIGYVVSPFKMMYDLTKAGVGWIWEQVQKIPGISTIVGWGEKAYGAGKYVVHKASEGISYFRNLGRDTAGELISSRGEIVKMQMLGMYERALLYKGAERDDMLARAVAIGKEYEEKTTAHVRELKAKGVDIAGEQKSAIDAKLAETRQIIEQIKESTKSFGDNVKEGYTNVGQAISSTTNTNTNNSRSFNNNYNSGGGGGSEFGFGTGDIHAGRVLQASGL
jgi:hypothetical protein